MRITATFLSTIINDKCGYFECKKDKFSDIVARANGRHVDNPISLGKRKLDSVNQFNRITVVYKSVIMFYSFVLFNGAFVLGISCAIFSLNRKVIFPIAFRLYCRFWEAVNGCYFVTSNVFEQLINLPLNCYKGLNNRR